MSRLKTGSSQLEDRTRRCCKILGGLVVRSERLIKLGVSWFSAKSIEVERLDPLSGVGRWLSTGGPKPYFV